MIELISSQSTNMYNVLLTMKVTLYVPMYNILFILNTR